MIVVALMAGLAGIAVGFAGAILVLGPPWVLSARAARRALLADAREAAEREDQGEGR